MSVVATLGLSSCILLLIRPGLDSKSRVQEEDVAGGRLRFVDIVAGVFNTLFCFGPTKPWTDGAAKIRRKATAVINAVMVVG